MPAGGSIIETIRAGTLCEPILMGKPNPTAFDIIKREHHLESEPLSKFIMVGDNLKTDILFGNNCKIDTLAVLTGNTNEHEIKRVIFDKQQAVDDGLPTYVSPYFAHDANEK